MKDIMKTLTVGLVGSLCIIAMFTFCAEPNGPFIDTAFIIKQLVCGAVLALGALAFGAMDKAGWFDNVDNRA